MRKHDLYIGPQPGLSSEGPPTHILQTLFTAWHRPLKFRAVMTHLKKTTATIIKTTIKNDGAVRVHAR